MKVKFLPQDIELEINPDQSVMEVAHQNGIKIKSVCNGMPSCAECRVKVVEGEYNVFPPSAKELSLIGTGYFIDRRRLSCQLRCFGDVVVDLSEQVNKQVDDQQRRPQGSLRKDDSEVSRAITGNLIEQEIELLSEIKEAPSQHNSKKRTNDGSGKSRNRNRNRNRNRHRKNRNNKKG